MFVFNVNGVQYKVTFQHFMEGKQWKTACTLRDVDGVHTPLKAIFPCRKGDTFKKDIGRRKALSRLCNTPDGAWHTFLRDAKSTIWNAFEQMGKVPLPPSGKGPKPAKKFDVEVTYTTSHLAGLEARGVKEALKNLRTLYPTVSCAKLTVDGVKKKFVLTPNGWVQKYLPPNEK